MASLDFDDLGDRHKTLEQAEAGRKCMYGLPIMARLDGKGFHNFTRGLERPYDHRLSSCMQFTARSLMDKTQCDLAYTQSDEITLVWKNEYIQGEDTKVFFNGKIQKMVSILAATATSEFQSAIRALLPEKALLLPLFDCRVWQVPNLQVAAENVMWRELDATKNSITMAAHNVYSHTQLQGKKSKEKLVMLEDKGIIWGEYPDFFKKGSYFVKRKVLKTLSEEELEKIPEQHRPIEPVLRSVIQELIIPKASSIDNLSGVLFHGEGVFLK